MTRGSYIQENFQQALDAFKNCGWEAAFTDVVENGLTSACLELCVAAKRAVNQGNRARSEVLYLLADTCSLVLSPGSVVEPFAPGYQGSEGRSAIPDDFSDSEINFLSQIVEHIDDPALKGRLADLIWLRQQPRDMKFALMAIDCYTENLPEPLAWSLETEQNWQRAVTLTRLLGGGAGDRLTGLETSIIDAFKSATEDDKSFASSLGRFLFSNRLGENHSGMIAKKLELLADSFRELSEFEGAERCYNDSAIWFTRFGDGEKASEMIVRSAESLTSEAINRASSDSPSYGVSAMLLEKAVQTYRSVPRARRNPHQVDQRIRDLRMKINEAGERALDELGVVSSDPIDIRHISRKAREAVTNKVPHEALRAFANLSAVVSVRQLREDAVRTLTEYPMRAMFPNIVSSADGRVIAKHPGMSGLIPTEADEAVISAEMIRMHYNPYIQSVVFGAILPAMDVLSLQHRIREAEFTELARLSPIVPVGREALFGKVLHLGYNRDFAACIHLLSPQIEHMVRYHLKQAGAVTTNLSPEGIENENGLSTLIEMPESVRVFGVDVAYEVKALFCDSFGHNIRNNIAHGLFGFQEADSPRSVYAWWLTLKLVFTSFWLSLGHHPESDEMGQDKED